MYLVRRCCDRPLPEIAEHFGTNGYATVSWNCRVVESQMAKGMRSKDRIKKIAASIDHPDPKSRMRLWSPKEANSGIDRRSTSCIGSQKNPPARGRILGTMRLVIEI